MDTDFTFDSEYCTVKYEESDNVVLLSWKKSARLTDYRQPALFALGLLKQHPHSNFIIDARHGFEDDPADVEWGFSGLLPAMAETDCSCVAFILEKMPAIEEEMNMWAKEFGKYFAVVNTKSYEEAVRRMKERVLVHVRYTIKSGKRDEFFGKVKMKGIIKDSREEPGNYAYDYYLPVDSKDDLFLMEMWTDSDAQAEHGKTTHYQKLQELKKEYVVSVTIEKYNSTRI
ncbi:MAG: putative quinol monooxygenase [Treponema sp.]